MLEDYNVKFTSKKRNIFKFFDGKNFFSFTLKSNIKWYILPIVTILVFLNYSVIIDLFEEKYNEKREIQFSLRTFFMAFGWIIIAIVIIFWMIFFSYNQRRIDIFIKDRILFIGITTICQKSYKKKYIFELESIEEFGFLENEKTLSIKLKNSNHQKIYKFSENKDDLKILSDKMQKLNNHSFYFDSSL